MPPDKVTKEPIEFLENQAIIVDDNAAEFNPEACIGDRSEANGSLAEAEYLNGLEHLIVIEGSEESPEQ